MDQPDNAAKNTAIIQGRAVRSCELRLERRSMDANGRERVEYICGASGGPEQGYILAVAGDDISSMVAICNSCPIPDALAAPQSCLTLVPIRRFSAGKRSLPVIQAHVQQTQEDQEDVQADVFFPCRWFYTLDGQNQPRHTYRCRGCPYWFPRPPLELFTDYWPITQKMLRVVNGEEIIVRPRTGFTPSNRQTTSKTWWRRLLQKIFF
ncbi:MAG TPA: hypothetical protein VFA09_15850 [Ktedonobacteraceae bacterium]|nr:hypothetical protein [Ktedonobacteraceae bacterium]